LSTADPAIPTKILIIDDDYLVRDFAVHTIEYGINHKVMTYDSGLQAWQFISSRHQEVDLIIADANIPDMSGLELLERVKTRFPEKVFIITSGDPETESQAKQLGAEAFISKPFDANDLFAVIKTFGTKPAPPREASVTVIEGNSKNDV
jgi:two-component system, response regulator YesN